MKLHSENLKLYGVSDVVEFHPAKSGVNIDGYNQTFDIVPVEYKKGHHKTNDCDRMQLCAQALCLEEMMETEIHKGALFYHEIRRREVVIFAKEIRDKTKEAVKQMHKILRSREIPESTFNKLCKACSLKNECIPKIKYESAKHYFRKMVNTINGDDYEKT